MKFLLTFLLGILSGPLPRTAAGTHVWGLNGDGQLGNGTTTTASRPIAAPASGVLAGKVITAIAAGSNHTLVLTADGLLFAWGDNQYGQLGDGTTTDRSVPVAVNMSGVLAGKTITTISAGSYHNVVLDSTGRVYNWGNNTYGQLGDGTLFSRPLPIAVSTAGVLSGKVLTAITAGSNHTLALASSGQIFSWGRNAEGALGDGTGTDRTLPVAVVMNGALAGRRVTAINTGRVHSLALTSDGRAYAWGLNDNGQLGNGSTIGSSVPVAVTVTGALAGKFVTAIDGGYWHTLAVTADGMLFSWGLNNYGQVGDSTTTAQRTAPVAVALPGSMAHQSFVSVSGGRYHSMALAANGTLFTWGRNNDNQLGDGSTVTRYSPGQLNNALTSEPLWGKAVTSIAAGGEFCIVTILGAEIAVEDQTGTAVEDKSSVADFGGLAPGGQVSRSFTVRNTGPEPLTISSAAITSGSTDFALLLPPATTLAPGAASTLTVNFQPLTAGTKTGTLRLLSNDADEAVWILSLSGKGYTHLEAWRQANFNTPDPAGAAANEADPDADGLDNFGEYAFARQPLTPDAAALPAWQQAGGELTLNFTAPPGISGVSYSAEYSTSLAPGSWVALPNQASPPSYLFSAPPAGRIYLRLRAVLP